LEEIFKSYGFGLFPFETIYFDRTDVHFLEDHYLRFKRTFWILGVEFDLGFEKFKEAIEKCIISAEKDYGGVRVAYVHDRLVVELKEIRYNKALFQKGFELAIARTKKDSKNILNY